MWGSKGELWRSRRSRTWQGSPCGSWDSIVVQVPVRIILYTWRFDSSYCCVFACVAIARLHVADLPGRPCPSVLPSTTAARPYLLSCPPHRSGPREDATRIGSAGVVRRQAVDISPLRRVNQVRIGRVA